jgi:hypothetical protein
VFPRIEVRTGCDGVKPKPKIRVHPVIKLRNYIEKHNIKLIDFFNKIDKDGSMTVSKDEFKRGILVIHKFLPSKQFKPQIKSQKPIQEYGCESNRR